MRLIRQPTKNTCGQTCVAMICDCDWAKAILAVGHLKRTRTRELVKALRSLGCLVEDHLTVLRGELPRIGTYLLKLSYPGWKSHWVVLHNGNYYDPAHGMNPELKEGWRFTSYLKIRRETQHAL